MTRPPTSPVPQSRQEMRDANAMMVQRILHEPLQRPADGAYALRVLQVRGRKSGRMIQVPLAVVHEHGRGYLLSPTRARDWVQNLLAAPTCALVAGGQTQAYRATLVTDAALLAPYRTYLQAITWAASQFPASPTASDQEILRQADAFAVFRLEPASTDRADAERGSLPRAVETGHGAANAGGVTSRDRLRQALNLVLALGQTATSWYVLATGAGAITSGDPKTITLMAPAGYAFSIWTPIFAGTAAYGIYQARPSLAGDPLLRRLGWLTAPAFLGTSLWLLAAQRQWIWTTVAVFTGMLACLGGVLAHLTRFEREHGPLPTTRQLVVRAPLSLFAGWTSAAVLANLAVALKLSGAFASADMERVVTSTLIATAGAAGATATRGTGGDRWYAGAVVWALVAIVAASVRRREVGPALTASAAAAIVAASARGSQPWAASIGMTRSRLERWLSAWQPRRASRS